MGLLALGLLYLEEFTYLAIFSFLVLCGTGFFPFPEEVTLLTAGYLASLGTIKLRIILPLALLGVLLGDSIFFIVGRKNPNALRKFGKMLILSKPILDKVHRFFKKHGEKTIFFTRFILGTRIPASFIAGSTGMKYSTFFLYDFAGIILWVPSLMTLGYLFGAYFDQLIVDFGKIKHLIFIILMIALLLWFGYYYFRYLLNPKRTKL